MQRTPLRPLVPIAAATLIAIPLGAHHEQSGGGAPPATFTFRALGENGAPVADLEAGDVTLKVDGRARALRSLDLVRFGGAAPPAGRALPPPFASNVSPRDRRDLLVLVDEESLTSGREGPLRAAIGALVAGIGPADRASLISMRQGGVNIGLTSDHALVKSNLTAIRAYSSNRETPSDLLCRTLRMVGTLETVFNSLGGRAPATVVMFSASAAVLAAGETARMRSETGSDLCQLRLDHFNQLTGAAQASRADFFVIEMLEVGGAQALPQASGGLENIAGAAGGEFSRLAGAADIQMAGILRATSAFYVATFDGEPSERAGAARRIEVGVTRPGVTVRSRTSLPASRAAGRKGVNPRDMLRTADHFTDLPLRSTAFSTRNVGDGKIKLVTLFEATDPATKLTAAMIGVYDEKGSLKAQWTAQGPDLARPTVMAATSIAPGRYRMRVAATDSSGRSGAVDSEIDAALITAGPIGLSDMAFGTAGPGGLTPVIQFGTQPSAIAFLELYGRPTGPLGAKVEVAETPDGPALAAVPVSASAGSQPDNFQLTATIPLESLKPGDYVVRAIIGVPGQPEGRVVRTLRKLGS
jgi:hypothetical protein